MQVKLQQGENQMNIFEELYTKDVQKSIYLRESSATIDNIYQKILGLLKEKNVFFLHAQGHNQPHNRL